MKYSAWIALCAVPVLLLLAGCKGADGPAGPQGPPGPAKSGHIIGFAQYSNEDHTYPTDKSGIVVSVVGTNITSTTDVNGRFDLAGVTTGTYNILASKPPFYANCVIPSYPFPGDTSYTSWWYGTMTCDHVPSFEVSTAAAAVAAPNINVSGTINSSVAYTRYVLVFAGKTSATSNVTGTFLYTNTAYIGSGTAWNTQLYGPGLVQSGFATGDTVHIAAYSAGGNYWSSEVYDPIHNVWGYTNVGSVVKTATVVMP